MSTAVRRAVVISPSEDSAKLMGSTMREWMVGKTVFVNYEGEPHRHLFPYFVTLDDSHTSYGSWGAAHKAEGTIPMTEDTLYFIDERSQPMARAQSPKKTGQPEGTENPPVVPEEKEGAEESVILPYQNVLSADRKKALDDLCSMVNKEFGEGALMRLGDPKARVAIETICSGSLTLDIAIGGGIPVGRWVELFGDEKSGKTTIAILHAIEVLKTGREVVFIDGEHALNPNWCTLLGLDINQILIHQPSPDPQTGLGGAIEDVYNLILKLARTGKVGLIILDSLPSIPSRSEIGGEKGIDEADFDDVQVAAQARKNSQATRMLTSTLAKQRCTLLIINQNRDKIGGFSRFGTPKMQTGGHALQYAHSVKIEVKNAEFLKPKGSGEDAKFIGQKIKCSVVKNKIAAPYKEATFNLYYERGLDRLDELFQMGKYTGVLQGSGWLTLADEQTGEIIGKWNGESKFKEAVIEQPELYDIIYARILRTVRGDTLADILEEQQEEVVE